MKKQSFSVILHISFEGYSYFFSSYRYKNMCPKKIEFNYFMYLHYFN